MCKAIQIKNSILEQYLYTGFKTVDEFNFDSLKTYPLIYFLNDYDISIINKIITDPRSNDPVKKFAILDDIMGQKNFYRLAGGTNRVVYAHNIINNIVIKIALSRSALSDNIREMYNQDFIKPYCCKVFEVSPCGTVGLFEKVYRITTRQEFNTIWEDIKFMLTNKILGKYVAKDIGWKEMFNYGIRIGFGPVILDFPYIYPLDGSKLICTGDETNNIKCNGLIDYTEDFDTLYCTKCGKIYEPIMLARKDFGSFTPKISRRIKGVENMKIEIVKGDNVIVEKDLSKEIPSSTHLKREAREPRPVDNINKIQTTVDPRKSYNKLPVVTIVSGNGNDFEEIKTTIEDDEKNIDNEKDNIFYTAEVTNDEYKETVGYEKHDIFTETSDTTIDNNQELKDEIISNDDEILNTSDDVLEEENTDNQDSNDYGKINISKEDILEILESSKNDSIDLGHLYTDDTDNDVNEIPETNREEKNNISKRYNIESSATRNKIHENSNMARECLSRRE